MGCLHLFGRQEDDHPVAIKNRKGSPAAGSFGTAPFRAGHAGGCQWQFHRASSVVAFRSGHACCSSKQAGCLPFWRSEKHQKSWECGCSEHLSVSDPCHHGAILTCPFFRLSIAMGGHGGASAAVGCLGWLAIIRKAPTLAPGGENARMRRRQRQRLRQAKRPGEGESVGGTGVGRRGAR